MGVLAGSLCREHPLVPCPQSLEGPRAGLLLGAPPALTVASLHPSIVGLGTPVEQAQTGWLTWGSLTSGAGQCSPLPTVQ